VQEVQANTAKIEATILAEGEKMVAEIHAQKQVDIAKLQKQIADIEAQTTRLLGEAKAKAQELKRRAEADRLVQQVNAIGGAEEYALYSFAQKLPDKLQIAIRYSGPGTFWTDLPNQLKNPEKLAGLKILETKKD
jgi:regulator of protease activity HflC (stomatin/prohibitin superfamily)